MPALFAYLIAIGLLLGGGYGALSWLAAPDPVKVAVKARPKPPPRYQASSKETPLETGSLAFNDSGQVASGPNNPPSSSQSEMSVAATDSHAEAESSGLPQAQQSHVANAHVANAEVSPAEARQVVGQSALAMSPVSASNAAASAAPATAARSVKRLHPRQGRHRSEKSALALMTLRTIEFADGRRVTRLIPYRGPERAPAFEPDE
jgi:hypothetical protein